MKRTLLFLIVLCFSYKLSIAQLSLDHILDSGVLITGGINTIGDYSAVSDGKGGAIILFVKQVNSDTIFAQRISSDGKLLWGTSISPKVVALKNNPENYQILTIGMIADDKGGIFFSYTEDGIDENSDFRHESYLQHLDSNGNALMGVSGIKIAYKNYYAGYPLIISDGGSGVIAVWTEKLWDFDLSRYKYSDIIAQKYSATGIPQWPNGGVQVCAGNSLKMSPAITADENKGVVIAFEDSRNCLPVDSLYNTDIYAQKLDSNGNLKWTTNGLPVSLKAGNQSPWEAFMQPNKNNFSISYSSYITYPTNSYNDINVQQLNLNGVRLWSNSGVQLDTLLDDGNFGDFENFKIKPDGKGGVAAFWGKYSFSDSDFYEYSFIQRLDSAAGNFMWPSIKINLLNDSDSLTIANDLTNDMAGNLIFSVLPFNDSETYSRVQKLNISGTPQWGSGGKNYWFDADKLLPQADGSIIALSNAFTNSDGQYDYSNIVAYKIDSNGNTVWHTSPFKTIRDGNWDDPSIWETGTVPYASSNVVVTNDILIAADAICNTLKISQGSKITVANGIHLTVLH